MRRVLASAALSLALLPGCSLPEVPPLPTPAPMSSSSPYERRTDPTTKAPAPTPSKERSSKGNSPAPESQPASLAGVVVRVSDGDTIRVRLRSGQEVTVRIIGIDTPETVSPSVPDECGGDEASRFAKGMLSGVRVVLVPDASQDRTDRYGRLLAYVEVDGVDYGLAALRAGHAGEYTYRRAYARQREYRAAQRQAQRERRGLWGHCSGINDPV